MTPAQNTKIERVIEAIENMALAVTVSQHNTKVTLTPAMAFDNVAEARAEAREALTDFLRPTLRVVGDDTHS